MRVYFSCSSEVITMKLFSCNLDTADGKSPVVTINHPVLKELMYNILIFAKGAAIALTTPVSENPCLCTRRIGIQVVSFNTVPNFADGNVAKDFVSSIS